ncbi:MAG: hypothetical protein ACKVOR_03705, partial [Flavobacteriales bacterium]
MKKFYLFYGAFAAIVLLTVCTENGLKQTEITSEMRRRLSEKAQAMLAQRDSALKAQVKNIVVTNNLEISDEDDL